MTKIFSLKGARSPFKLGLKSEHPCLFVSYCLCDLL